ncbi:MAG: cytochrome c3 family protein [Pyrinomonadaceae bacterium]
MSSCQKSAQSGSSTTAKMAAPAPTDAPAAGGATIEKVFHLGTDSQDEHGEVVFNHDSHAYQKYSPDGKSVMGCTECHHTNQPKSALKPPDKTSTSDTALSLAAFQAGQKVQNCRTCHFQDGNLPEGKEMPQATYTVDGNSVTKDLNNQLAYHINCNTCHDAALAARPELKSKPGFAGSKDCMICHKKN